MIPIFTRLNPNDGDGRSGNPGDYFICLGVQHLISAAVGEQEWLFVDKFSKENASAVWKMVGEAGVMFYASMPQYNIFSDWSFWYDDEMWTNLVEPTGVKVVSLAGGAGCTSTSITPAEFADACAADEETRRIMATRKRCLAAATARDPYAKAVLDRFEVPSTILPCAAVFSGRRYRSSASPWTCLVVPPSPGSLCVGSEDKVERVVGWTMRVCEELARRGRSPVVVCHALAEYEAISKTDLPVEYSNNYEWFLRKYETCGEIVSARLHATVPTYGMCAAKCVNVAVDTRGSAAGLLPGVPCFSFYDAEHDHEALVSALDDAKICDPSWLSKVEEQYVRLILGVVS